MTTRELLNAPDKGQAFAVFADNPGLMRLLARMRRAQVGEDLDVDDAVLDAEGRALAETETETEDDEP